VSHHNWCTCAGYIAGPCPARTNDEVHQEVQCSPPTYCLLSLPRIVSAVLHWQQAFHGVVELFQQASNNAVERGICTQLDPEIIPQMIARPIQQASVVPTSTTSSTNPVVNVVPIQVQSPQAASLRLPTLALRPSTSSPSVRTNSTTTLPGGSLLKRKEKS